MPKLLLDLPWAPHQEIGELRVQRAKRSVLIYEDGIDLAVEVVNPGGFESAEDLLSHVSELDRPGSVVLVAGAIPIGWRPMLRSSGISFVDVSGVAEINWPRLNVSTGQFVKSPHRRRAPLPMQKGHAAVVQEALVSALRDERPTVSELADRSLVSLSTASRALTQLASHGLLVKHREGIRVTVQIADTTAVATLLAQRTSWPQGITVTGYQWGRNIFEVAERLSRGAQESGLELSITGRSALPFLGIMSTAAPRKVRCWVAASEEELTQVADQLRLEPAAEEDSNVQIAADPWGIGSLRRAERTYQDWNAWVSHPIRVWCDVQSEPRGSEFAAQLWSEVERYG